MQAIQYASFGGPLELVDIPSPEVPPDGVRLQVRVAGLCRSDWHGWMGHDPDIRLPHVPGHELAGVIDAVGTDVRRWKPGERVTVPFACGCGNCTWCVQGDPQICDRYFQPGFTAWGGFAEQVAIRYADANLVRLPSWIDDATAAPLGCRFTTAFRAVLAQGRARAGEWVAVYGCGGVGLAAVMIAAAAGTSVIAVDRSTAALDLARACGATHAIDVRTVPDPVQAVKEWTGGGAHLAVDALGSGVTCRQAIRSLRKRGRHVQVGLMNGPEQNPAVPMHEVIAKELEILGSHGMAAHAFDAVFALIAAKRLDPARLIQRTIGLAEVPSALEDMGQFSSPGITVVRISG